MTEPTAPAPAPDPRIVTPTGGHAERVSTVVRYLEKNRDKFTEDAAGPEEDSQGVEMAAELALAEFGDFLSECVKVKQLLDLEGFGGGSGRVIHVDLLTSKHSKLS